MKTALFGPFYLDGLDPSKTQRIDRVIRHAKYYRDLQKHLGFEKMYFSDDGSSFENLAKFERTIPEAAIFRHDKLARPEGVADCNYPWCWQALWDTQKLIDMGYEKIIHIDNDTFVLSQRLANYIRGIDTGWSAFEVPEYGFASAELHVMCKDSFEVFKRFTSRPFMSMNGQMMEQVTPYTHVVPLFIGGRYGEKRLQQKPEWDWASQIPGDVPMTFAMEED